MIKNRLLFASDSLMEKTFEALNRDFSHTLGPLVYRRVQLAIMQGGSARRSIVWPNAMLRSSYAFKCQYQLENFNKRYIYADDPFTSETLKQGSLAKFTQDQELIGIRELSKTTKMVVARAKDEIARVLGKPNYEEWFQKCRFGKRAAHGLPASEAYKDIRMRRMYGSRAQRAAFKTLLLGDNLLSRIVELQEPLHDYNGPDPVLRLTAVPKTWKSMRIIAPDTNLGAFLASGLGSLIRSRLERATHIKLASAQVKHKLLAKEASVRGHLVTADLSRASDSFTWEHAKMLLPEQWYALIAVCRSRKYKVDTTELDLKSLMLMGSGHTFPLQTLFFYSLLKGIADCLGDARKCYVFGDDLIYPRAWHPFVVRAFTELGFQLNSEKTFASGPFRESCGGDYHRGLDVRPCMPEGSSCMLSSKSYSAFCYKLLNGLLARWDWTDIPSTFEMLLHEIERASKAILIVPPYEPDYAGLKFIDPCLLSHRVAWPKIVDQALVYGRLTPKRVTRVVQDELPYYWSVLTGDLQQEDDPKEWFSTCDKTLNVPLWARLRSHRYERGTTQYTHGPDMFRSVLTLEKGRATEPAKLRDVRYRYEITELHDSAWPCRVWFQLHAVNEPPPLCGKVLSPLPTPVPVFSNRYNKRLLRAGSRIPTWMLGMM